MKTMRKLFSIILCICLVLGCTSMIALADETPTGSITIENPTHSEATVAGKTFNVYKIFNATTSGTNTSYSWYKDADNNIPFYDFFYGENGVVEKNKEKGSVQGAVTYLTEKHKEGSLALSQLAEALHTYIAQENTDADENKIATIVDPVTVPEGQTSVKIDDLEFGYYLVYDDTDLSLSTSAVRSAVMLTTVNKDAVVTLKANRPEIEKTVLENDGKTWGKGTSSMIGDVVTFKIETLVPSHTLYKEYKYYINDVLPSGLTLNDDSIKVYLEAGDDSEPQELVKDMDYTCSIPGDEVEGEAADFKVDFTPRMTGDDQYAIGDKLIITYTAKVTDAIVAQKANVNTAILSYTNDPTTEGSVGTTSDTANVYSYQFVFSKFAQDTNGVYVNKRLIGAEFQLYKVVGDTEVLINFTTVEATNAAGVNFTRYIVAEEAMEGTTTNVLNVHETGDETLTLDHFNYGGHRGDVFIFGLSEGTYKLVETKAPDGYILPDDPFVITITDEIGSMGSVGTLTVAGTHQGNGKIVNATARAEQILTVWADITNAPGSALPETGGMGTTLFMVLGVLMMVGAVAFFTSRKRSNIF